MLESASKCDKDQCVCVPLCVTVHMNQLPEISLSQLTTEVRKLSSVHLIPYRDVIIDFVNGYCTL